MRMQKIKPSHTPEGVRSLRLGECIYFDNVVLPQDYGWIWRSIFGNPITDVFADELSGKAEFYLATNQDNQSGASVATAIGLYFRLVVPVGVLLFGSNPAYSYGGSLYSNFDSCYTDAWTGLYVGRYLRWQVWRCSCKYNISLTGPQHRLGLGIRSRPWN
jgi:hypothetical protein